MVGRLDARATHRWRFPERDCLVRMPDEVLDVMQRMAAKAAPRETGGTLVGHYSQDNRVAFVAQVLEAKVGARRERTRFYRPSDDVDDQLARIYQASRGHIYYLGDWHTHPDADPIPSPTDLNTLRGLARSPSVATDTPIMVILGGNLDSYPSTSCTLAEKSGRCLDGEYERE